MRGPLLMGRLAPLRRDLALTLSIHPREATPAALPFFIARHDDFLPRGTSPASLT